MGNVVSSILGSTATEQNHTIDSTDYVLVLYTSDRLKIK